MITFAWASHWQDDSESRSDLKDAAAFNEAPLGTGDGMSDSQTQSSALRFATAKRRGAVEALEDKGQVLVGDSNTLVRETTSNHAVPLF